jgi:hypothetical protein
MVRVLCSWRLHLQIHGLLSVLLLGSASASLYRALEEVPPARPTVNCRGCFNRTSGVCTVDTGDGRSCSNATRNDCEGLGETYVDGNANAWPVGGCLVQVAAKCLADLEPYECGSSAEKYTLHANTTDQCLRDAKAMGASVSSELVLHPICCASANAISKTRSNR